VSDNSGGGIGRTWEWIRILPAVFANAVPERPPKGHHFATVANL
jgi:hypothetical protein